VGVAVDAGIKPAAGLDALFGQRFQRWFLDREVLADGVRAHADAAAVSSDVVAVDQLVQLIDGLDFGHRHQVVATEPAMSPSTPPFSWATSMPG
jgi:hypothetical protein